MMCVIAGLRRAVYVSPRKGERPMLFTITGLRRAGHVLLARAKPISSATAAHPRDTRHCCKREKPILSAIASLRRAGHVLLRRRKLMLFIIASFRRARYVLLRGG